MCHQANANTNVAGTIASNAASPPGQCAPAPSAPQNVPKDVSITPTANLSVFSGTRCNGEWIATPAAVTASTATPAATAAIPMWC